MPFFIRRAASDRLTFCSAPLSAVLAVEKLSRPQVVKKLWEYIRSHELQNPSNRKEIVCDDALRAVFAVDKIDMFRMNKVLGQCVAPRQRRSSRLLSSQASSRGIIGGVVRSTSAGSSITNLFHWAFSVQE